MVPRFPVSILLLGFEAEDTLVRWRRPWSSVHTPRANCSLASIAMYGTHFRVGATQTSVSKPFARLGTTRERTPLYLRISPSGEAQGTDKHDQRAARQKMLFEPGLPLLSGE